MPDSELKSDHDGSGISKVKHSRWHSTDSPLAATGAGTMHVARRSIEATWFGRPNRGVLISDPREVADVAKVFDGLVRMFLVHCGTVVLTLMLHLRWVAFLSMKSTAPSTSRCY